MELQFLGTSSGTPSRARNVSGLALRATGSKHWYLVDCGEGTQHRILRTNYSPMSLRAIFITHIHGDHCYGLPGLLASAGRKANVARARELLGVPAPPEAEETAPTPEPDWRPPCPCCGGRMIVIQIFDRAAQARAPPSSPARTGAAVS